MGSTADKIKGAANEAMGNVKQGVGRATGSKKTEAEGAAQEVKGEAQQLKGKAKSAVKNATDRV